MAQANGPLGPAMSGNDANPAATDSGAVMSDRSPVRVLLVDDEAALWLPQLRRPLLAEGIELAGEADPERALERIAKEQPDALLLDVLFPDATGEQAPRGKELLPAIVAAHPELPIVMFTTTLADEAMRLSASDFPGAMFVFSKSVFREAKRDPSKPIADLARSLNEAVATAEQRTSLDERIGFVVGRSPSMHELAAAMLKVAPTDLPVLIVGESGTGKELIASSIHRLSRRKDRPFVKLNCGVLSDETLESALFGHEKGAYTGAADARTGLFEAADSGTLLLDEVQTMSSRLQQSLLRVLQEGVIRRMGGTAERRVDVRIIAATNEDLEERIREGTFRPDLYYRLNRVRLHVPPLRERKDDIASMYALFIDEANRRLGKMVSTQCRRDLLELLAAHQWPGNVRELQAGIETAVALSKANVLTPQDFADLTLKPGVNVERDATSDMPSLPAHLHQLTWNELKDIKGVRRRELLLAHIGERARTLGRRPTSAELARSLHTSADNVRRILSEAGIRLRNAVST